ncbi:hypothetical protein FBGL_13225 [Flavobacterium glycines]|uniref:Uncharacterized protein n=1 Tax=Flavobacterium glycines TaxID=551990 RepID=A0A1B9DJJ1_9FLAO|nr:hypothetical protein FBGL_13225 [Flavobacterium glycines]
MKLQPLSIGLTFTKSKKLAFLYSYIFSCWFYYVNFAVNFKKGSVLNYNYFTFFNSKFIS